MSVASEDELYITETVSGVYFYHLTRERKNGQHTALCGESFTGMETRATLSSWGYRGHLGEHYCKGCTGARDGEVASG